MVDAGGLYPTSQNIEIRVAGGDLTVTDGPYSEVKEVVGGYSIIGVAPRRRRSLRHCGLPRSISSTGRPGRARPRFDASADRDEGPPTAG